MNSTLKQNSMIEKLMQEVMSGELQKDTLPNSALSFSGEQQALYFSNLRRNLQSDMAKIVMTSSHNLDELEMLKKRKG